MAAPNLRGIRKDANGDLYWAIGGLLYTYPETDYTVVGKRKGVQVKRPTTTTGEEEGLPAQCADLEDRQNKQRTIGAYEFQAFEAVKESWTASDWLLAGALVLGAVAVVALAVTTGPGAAVALAVVGNLGMTSATAGGVAAAAGATAKIASAGAMTLWFASNAVEADVDEEDYDVGNAIGNKWQEEHPLSDWANVGNVYEVQVTPEKNC